MTDGKINSCKTGISYDFFPLLLRAGKIHLTYQCISDPDLKCDKTLSKCTFPDHQSGFMRLLEIIAREGYHSQVVEETFLG